jgi:homospermidine synthase
MLHFSKRILFVGFVARCTLPVLIKHAKVRPEDPWQFKNSSLTDGD